MENLFDILYMILFLLMIFGPALAGIIWFAVSLIAFGRTDKTSPKLRGRRILLTVSACVAGGLTLATLILILLFFIAIAHM